MVVPKKKHTPSAVGQRRSHHALKKVTLSVCPQCKKAVKPHTACAFCGTYKGKQVIKIKEKAVKKKEKR